MGHADHRRAHPLGPALGRAQPRPPRRRHPPLGLLPHPGGDRSAARAARSDRRSAPRRTPGARRCRRSSATGFVRAIVDPFVNAIHRAFLRAPRQLDDDLRATRRALVDRGSARGSGRRWARRSGASSCSIPMPWTRSTSACGRSRTGPAPRAGDGRGNGRRRRRGEGLRRARHPDGGGLRPRRARARHARRVGDGQRGRGARAARPGVRATPPRPSRRRAAGAVERGAREAPHRLGRRRDAGRRAGGQHLDPRAGGAGGVGAARRAPGRVRGDRSRRLLPRHPRPERRGRPHVGRAVVRRHPPPLLSPGPARRRRPSRAAAYLGRCGSRDGRRDRPRRPRGARDPAAAHRVGAARAARLRARARRCSPTATVGAPSGAPPSAPRWCDTSVCSGAGSRRSAAPPRPPTSTRTSRVATSRS